MSDLFLTWPSPDGTVGGDLQVSTDGDIATVDGFAETIQRIFRRWFSNPRTVNQTNTGFLSPDDPFNPTYGVGLRSTIGKRFSQIVQSTRNAMLGGMRAEPGVSFTPPPSVTFQELNGGFAVAGSFTPAGSNVAHPIPLTPISE
jgi:hypothetical protein